ncbi:ATP-binding protein [Streptomyces sp. UNOB3_S3]|uniref:ATP-binding protein n=1 Tax=Streptomyces sp. UNOB3_S3 TaxID=2871682 RepID=UPI001E2C0DEA|nr:ATP-binding protein [Streptomyces sp. UNOB3_S3]MCC3778682.1 ATP-binding protein [Streptomyces sp. UNOB3_S3]
MGTASLERYELMAPAIAPTARVAREFVTAVLVAAERHPLIESARICVSDTVANVVQHARVPVLAVEVTVHGDRVVVAVRDDDPVRRPYRRLGEATAEDEHGRGLALVRGLAAASGVTLVWRDLAVVGKSVWFELREPVALSA